MPTEKPRVTFTLDKETLQKIDEYRFSSKSKNQSQAILSLIEKGLSELEPELRTTPLYSSEVMQVAQDYDSLDHWGKQVVRSVIDDEKERCEDEKNFRLAFQEEKPEPKVIPLFLSAPAAGIAAPIMGEDYVDYTLKDDDPPAAMFSVKVDGDSMEPDFPDGSMVFCNKDPLQNGDIGVFAVDGESVIKQYYYDRLMGITYLFSLNRKRADADITLTRSSGQTLTCLGRVITKRRYKLPGATF